MILVIDADSIAYKLADKCIVVGDAAAKGFEAEDGFSGNELETTRLEHHTDEDGHSYVIETSIEIAKQLVQDYIDDMIDNANDILAVTAEPVDFQEKPKIEDYVLFLTAGQKVSHLYKQKYGYDNIVKCFRYEIADDSLEHGYKHKRISKPLHGYITIMEAMALHFNSEMFDYIEADDVCVSLCNTYPEEFFLAALDKDVLNQTVGNHLNYGKLGTDEALYNTSSKYAIFYKYWQTILGDPTDGYKGIPGVGKVGAAKMINPDMSEAEMYDIILNKYISKGLGEQEFIATMRLADMTQVKIDKLTFTNDGKFNFKWHLELYQSPKGAN